MAPRPYPWQAVAHGAAATLLLLNLALIAAWPLIPGSALRQAADPVYAALCHRLPERCYVVGGEPMPVCARCLGLWAGLAVAALLGALGFDRLRCWRLSTAGGLLAVLLASWLAGRYVLPGDWHAERTVAGFLGGVGCYVFTTVAAAYLLGRLAHLSRLRGIVRRHTRTVDSELRGG